MDSKIIEKLIDLFWEGLSDYSSDVWFDSSSNDKERLLWWALEKLDEPIDEEEALNIFWQWADGLEEDSFVDFNGLAESQTLKTMETDRIKFKQDGRVIKIYKDGQLAATCDDKIEEVDDALKKLVAEIEKEDQTTAQTHVSPNNKYFVFWFSLDEKGKITGHNSKTVIATNVEAAKELVKKENIPGMTGLRVAKVYESAGSDFAADFKLYENLWD